MPASRAIAGRKTGRTIMRHRPDWTSLVAASYDLRGSDPAWISRVARLAAPVLNGGVAPPAWAFSYTPDSFSLGHLSPACVQAIVRIPQSAIALPPEASLDRAHGAGYTHLVTRLTDLLVIHCLDGAGSGVCLGTLLANPTPSSCHQRRRWARVAAHLGAAFRLRTLFHTLARDAGDAPSGLDGCRTLHQVVRRSAVDRADAGMASAHWEALVHGRWSMLDRFDADGRRFVVAVCNDSPCCDPRGLTPRERQVAEFAGQGKAVKEIAYLMGVTEAAVGNCMARVQHKLGLRSLVELAAFFARGGLRRDLAEVAVARERLLVGSYPLLDPCVAACLSPAEQAVVAQLMAGANCATIAALRGTSRRTVANQLQAAYRKLGVRSRAELAVRLQPPA